MHFLIFDKNANKTQNTKDKDIFYENPLVNNPPYQINYFTTTLVNNPPYQIPLWTFLFSHVHYKWLDILYSAYCTPPCQIILYTKYTPPNFSNARSHQTRNTPLPSNLTWIQTLPWIINPTRQKGKIIFDYKNDIIKGPLLCNPEIKTMKKNMALLTIDV